MATETGNDDGYDVPVQLHPHTEALTALLMPDGGELLPPDQGRDRDEQQQHELAEAGLLQRQDLSQPDNQSKFGMWVSPPALLSLREQTKQLQHQKRAKQRQHITLDTNPGRFELPRDLKQHEPQQTVGSDARSYQLVGERSSLPQSVATPHRRERDGGVVVPLRMMASLVITDGAGGAAGGAVRDQAAAGDSRRQQDGQQQQAGEIRPRMQPLLGPSADTNRQPSSVAAVVEWRAVDGSQQYHHPHGHHELTFGPNLQHRQNPVPVTTGSLLAPAPLSAEHAHLDSSLHRELQQHRQPSMQHHHQQHARASDPAAGAGLGEEEDGAMLIDVGSADRMAEGALLPTPERPRVAGASAGWDALRGLGLRSGAASASAGAGGGSVAATLALLTTPPEPLDGSVGDYPGETALRRQQQGLLDHAMYEHAPTSAGATHARQGHQLSSLQQQPGQQRRHLGLATAGGGAGADGDEGFDADDEGETARRVERARVAFRLGGRSTKLRPLPGLSGSTPWSSLTSAASASERLGLASFSSLAMALPGDLSTGSSADLKQHARLPGFGAPVHSHLGPNSGTGVGADLDLTEVLKLKCSLRRAMQGHNSQAIGLILSLLAALSMTADLLADSQVAALVSPLQHNSNSQVAAAARHLMAMWKGVLKAAVLRPTSFMAAPGTQQAAAAALGGSGDGGRALQDHHSLHQQHHSHGPHASSLPQMGFLSLGRDDPRECDVPMRDQAELHQRHASAVHERLLPQDRRFHALSLVRSQSDVLAEGAAAAEGAMCHLAVSRNPPAVMQLTTQHSFRDVLTEPHMQAHPVAAAPGVRGSVGFVSHGQAQGQVQVTQLTGHGASGGTGVDGGRYKAGLDSSPSESREVTEAEARSSGEDTNEDGVAGAGAVAAAAGAGDSGFVRRSEERQNGSGGSGTNPGGTLSYSPAAGGGGCADLLHRFKLCANVANVGVPGSGMGMPAPATGAALHSPSPMSLTMREMGPAPVQPSPSMPNQVAMLPLTSMAAGAPAAAMLLVPPPPSQPSGRKRKVERERPSSRRRSSNPSKRAAPSGVVGQLPGPRPVHSNLPMSMLGEAAGGASDDPRHPRPHGPVAGLKTPARSSLLGLHAPLSKRQRHHAGGSVAPHAGGGGHHNATQVRRMSLLLSSLELGSGGGEVAEAWGQQVAAAMEGDADADANMGSQDDQAAMITSDDDELPVGNGVAAGGFPEPDGGSGSSGKRDGDKLRLLPLERVANAMGAPWGGGNASAGAAVLAAGGACGGGPDSGAGGAALGFSAGGGSAGPLPLRMDPASAALGPTTQAARVQVGKAGGEQMLVHSFEPREAQALRGGQQGVPGLGGGVAGGTRLPPAPARSSAPGIAWMRPASTDVCVTCPVTGSGTSTSTGDAAAGQGAVQSAQFVSI